MGLILEVQQYIYLFFDDFKNATTVKPDAVQL